VPVCLASLVAPPGQGWLRSTLRAQKLIDLDSLGYPTGEPGAPVEIVEFGDFGCSTCAEFATQTWTDFHSEFIETGIVAWRFVPFVLGSFRNSREAATAAECVADLAPEAFWSMHDVLYERREDWIRRRRPKGELRSLAEEVGVDGNAFENCYDGRSAKERIDRNNDVAKALGVVGTPTFFVNGRPVMGALTLSEWRRLIETVRAEGAASRPGGQPGDLQLSAWRRALESAPRGWASGRP
jgi:protein-disulfide isomerase